MTAGAGPCDLGPPAMAGFNERGRVHGTRIVGGFWSCEGDPGLQPPKAKWPCDALVPSSETTSDFWPAGNRCAFKPLRPWKCAGAAAGPPLNCAPSRAPQPHPGRPSTGSQLLPRPAERPAVPTRTSLRQSRDSGRGEVPANTVCTGTLQEGGHLALQLRQPSEQPSLTWPFFWALFAGLWRKRICRW